jgi:hypothetical protein
MTPLARRLAAGLGLALASLAAAAADAPVEGTWQKHEYVLSYAGFTSHYSCDGLEDKLRLLLKEAGARPGAQVSATCSDFRGGPSRIATARMTFYTLAPGVPGSTPAATPAAPARQLGRDAPVLKKTAEPERGVGAWKSVDWHAGSPRELDLGDCELVEQFAREILPLFTTRNIEDRMSCVPHQLTLGSVQLKFGVLAALPEAERPKPAARAQ